MTDSRTHIPIVKFMLVVLLLVVVPVLLFAVVSRAGSDYALSAYIFSVLGVVLFSFFFFHQKIVLFEPIVLFSAYYFTVLISAFYSIFTDFRHNVFINATTFNHDLSTLVTLTSVYFLLGYLFCLAGYYTTRKSSQTIEISIRKNRDIPDTILDLFIVIFLIIGIGNFAINVWRFAGGNVFFYFSNIAVRYIEFSEGGTTLGYLFAETAIFIWLYQLTRNKKNVDFPFGVVFVVTILLRASTGRVFSTFAYTATVVGMIYYVNLSRNAKITNSKYIILGIISIFAAIGFYFFRIISSLHYSNIMATTVWDTARGLALQFGYYAVDKGNIPNIGVVVKIIDSWQRDIGYLFGESLMTWVSNILPSSVRPFGYQPSVMIKQIWYSHIAGGNLPPTGIGEGYANFGPVGPMVVMFVVGAGMGKIYSLALKSRSYWVYVIVLRIAISFFMLYPKGEMDNLTLFSVLPIVLVVLAMHFVARATKTIREPEVSTS